MVHQASRPQRAGRPVLDLLASKLRRPLARPGSVSRPALIGRLAGDPRPLVSVVAPGGYGKTTLLAHWAEVNGQAFAWVSLDDADNDPKVLLAYVAQALDAVEPIHERVFDALASPASSVLGSVVPRLGSAFASMTTPVALVLDDVHVLRNRECQAAVSLLADHVPAGSRLVLAGRVEPPVQVARLRAEGKLLEIGPGDLSLSLSEASSLLRAAGITLDGDELAGLHRQTEGWPAGLYLAALYLREGGVLADAVASFGGDDRFVSDYLESEFLARITWRQRVFLTRTAVLERMCGSVCDAVLDQERCAATLAELAQANLLLVPLDRSGQWYRYHHLFRDMLLAELNRQEPQIVPVLQHRAAAWCRSNGLSEEALEYFIAAGDTGEAGALVGELWAQTYRQGRVTTVRRWVRWLEERGATGERPRLVALAGLMGAFTGRPTEAERWADALDRWQHQDPNLAEDPAAEGWAAVLRAEMCRHGVQQMRADADEAARKLAGQHVAPPVAVALQGMACLLSGDIDGGDAFFADAVTIAKEIGAHFMLGVVLAERALVAMARGEWDRAQALADQARAVVRQTGVDEDALVYAVQARIALRRADITAARRELTQSQQLRPGLTWAIPHFAVQARIELARAYLALADLAGARTLMREIDELLRRCPALGTLTGEAAALRAQLAEQRGTGIAGASTLTTAELRLLPLLPTHLPLHEIAAEMCLSPHTVRTQAKSIYRKLGATTRSQAVAQARGLGLLES